MVCIRHRRWPLLCEAASLVLLDGAVGQNPDRQTPEWLPLQRNHSQAGNGDNHETPYSPSPIVDPFSDVDCKVENCTGDASCPAFPYRLCGSYAGCDSYTKVCLHKQLFPMLPEDLTLFAVMFLIAVCAGAAGIGGGGLNVPILMMVSSFGIKEAVPLSHAAVMGNAFAQLMVNSPQRHPNAESRPLIHYELAILALPAQLGGNSLGVLVEQIFPPTLLIVLSLLMLTLAVTKTFMKAVDVFKAFRQKKRGVIAPAQTLSLPLASGSPAGLPEVPHRADRAGGSPAARSPAVKDLGLPTAPVNRLECVRTWSGTHLVMPRSEVSEHSTTVSVMRSSPRSMSPTQIGAAEAVGEDVVPVRIPWKVIATMVVFNIVFCFDFLGMAPDVFHVQKCSSPYWIILIGLYPFVIGSIWIGITSLKSLAAYHRDRGDPPIPGDPEVTMRLVSLFPLASVLIGLVAGLVGLGGGEFMVPLLLEFGLQPRVAAATSGFLILFATSSNIVHYLVANIMQPFIQYGVAVFILAFLGALTGLSIRDTKFLREHSYLLVFLLTGLLFVSMILLGYRGFVMSTMDWGFKPFCPHVDR